MAAERVTLKQVGLFPRFKEYIFFSFILSNKYFTIETVVESTIRHLSIRVKITLRSKEFMIFFTNKI